MGFLPEVPKQTSRANKVSRFMRLDEGKPVTVQILEETATAYWKLWFKDKANRWVGWASKDGELCPISQRNAEIRHSDPQNYKNNPEYVKPSRQYAVNVLDVTPMVVCEECGAAYFPQDKPAACDCGTDLKDVKVQPLNQVRVLERGSRLFSALEILGTGTEVLDNEGEPTGEVIPIVPDPENPEKNLPLTKFCVQIHRRGKKQETVTNPLPMAHLPVVDVEEYEDELLTLPLRPNISMEELAEVASHKVSMSEIYAARDAERDTQEDDKTGDTSKDMLWS